MDNRYLFAIVLGLLGLVSLRKMTNFGDVSLLFWMIGMVSIFVAGLIIGKISN